MIHNLNKTGLGRVEPMDRRKFNGCKPVPPAAMSWAETENPGNA